MQGHGVVVTGTALSGEVNTGQQVRCLPGGELFRVRSLQVHGRSVDRAGWGQRVALNLSGPERASIERGHVICNEKLTLTSDRFDAILEVRPAAAKGIKNHQLRVHLGTAERIAKIILLDAKDKVGPKESIYCQFTLSEPLLALRDDHFIVRDETARKTLAGGIIIHPWAEKHKRREPDLQSRLESLHTGNVTHLIESFLNESGDFALPLESIHQFLNLQEDRVRALLDKIIGLRAFNAEGERLYSTDSKWRRLKEAFLALLKEFHRTHPLLPGMDMEEVRGKLPYLLSPKIFRAVVDALLLDKIIAKEENRLRTTEHRIQLGSQEKSLMDKIKQILAGQPMSPPDLKEVEKQLGVNHNKLTEVIRLLERDGSVTRVTADLYYLSGTVDQVRAVLKKYLADKGEISAASFRDLIGSSRKYTIPLLEYFDREGVTLRIGDVRRLKSSSSSAK
jgi:selenocysteine-specific elongation factor